MVRVHTACTGEVMAQAKRPALVLLPDEQKQQRSTDEETAPKKTQKIFLKPEKLAQAMEREREPCCAMKKELHLLLFVIKCKCFDDEEITTRASEASQDTTQDSLCLFLVCKSCNQRPSLFNARAI
jgi:hypothetical protein